MPNPPPRAPSPPIRAPSPPPPRVVAPRGEPEDPTRAALLEVLRLLNQAESYHDEREKGLELDEIRGGMQEHWSVQKAGVNVPVVVGLLLRNRMVDLVGGTVRSWTRQRDIGPHYRINGEGKMYLAKWLSESKRVASQQGQRL